MEVRECAACVSFAAGLQALEFLSSRYGRTPLRLTGEDPCPPTGGTVFVKGPPERHYDNPYLYILTFSRGVGDDAHAADYLEWLTAHMHWAVRADIVAFVNPRHLNGNGAFEAEHLAGFERELRELIEPVAR